MAKNRISDLRDHLFETIERLKDKDDGMELDRARAICAVSQQIIESAKVEVQMVKAVSGMAPTDGFFNLREESRQLPASIIGGNRKHIAS